MESETGTACPAPGRQTPPFSPVPDLAAPLRACAVSFAPAQCALGAAPGQDARVLGGGERGGPGRALGPREGAGRGPGAAVVVRGGRGDPGAAVVAGGGLWLASRARSGQSGQPGRLGPPTPGTPRGGVWGLRGAGLWGRRGPILGGCRWVLRSGEGGLGQGFWVSWAGEGCLGPSGRGGRGVWVGPSVVTAGSPWEGGGSGGEQDVWVPGGHLRPWGDTWVSGMASGSLMGAEGGHRTPGSLGGGHTWVACGK